MKHLLLTLAVFALAFTSTFAQPVASPNEDGPSPVPVDGGASILLGAGAIMGYKRLTKKK
ncbi:MAG: PID-CTERM protein-sorting domain-containing protein [Flexibacteraceae bacterium]